MTENRGKLKSPGTPACNPTENRVREKLHGATDRGKGGIDQGAPDVEAVNPEELSEAGTVSDMRAEMDANEDDCALCNLLLSCTHTDEFRENDEAVACWPLANNAEKPNLEEERACVTNKPNVESCLLFDQVGQM